MGKPKNKVFKKHATISLFWLFYDHCRWVLAPFAALYFRIKKTYINKKVTKAQIKKGALITCNHISFGDALMLQYAFPYRRIHSMVLQKVFETKIGAFFFRGINCFPIDPDHFSFEPIRECTDRLKAGYCVVMFPEGHINFDNKPNIKGFQNGAVFMAVQAHSIIIPSFIYRKNGKGRFHLYVGEPFNPYDCFEGIPTVEKIQLATAKLHEIETKMQADYLAMIGKK